MIDRLISRKEATRATGLNRAQLNELNRKGLLRIVKLNARVYRIPESDLVDLTNRIEEHNTMEAITEMDGKSSMSREVEEGLREIYGYVPGARI